MQAIGLMALSRCGSHAHDLIHDTDSLVLRWIVGLPVRVYAAACIRVPRQQIAEIVERLREDEDEQLHARRAPIAGKLEELARAEPDYDELISEVMRSPLVCEDIETRKKAAMCHNVQSASSSTVEGLAVHPEE